MTGQMSGKRLYAVALEFDSPTQLVEAARGMHDRGVKRFETYSPYPVKELDEIIPGPNFVPFWTLTGGLLGALTALAMEYYIAVIDYPTNIGGRPLNSWPAFIPITFELTVLFAAISAFVSSLWSAGLPLLHHPVFNLREFARASEDRFFLFVEAGDDAFAVGDLRSWLATLNALAIWDVDEDSEEEA